MAKRKSTGEAPSMGDLTEPLTPESTPTEPYVRPPETLTPETDEDVDFDPEIRKLERERRRYVRRRGGFRKNLNRADKARAETLSEQVGTPVEQGWMKMHIDRYDNITHGERRGREWNAEKDKQQGPLANAQ
jgi:hypothetical protein